MPQRFVDTVSTFVKQQNLLDKNKSYIVALSGGADSVALLLVMIKMGIHVHAVHCNFHLRGNEADRDENFCRSLCEERGVGIHIAHFATAEYAAAHKVSIEMAARFLRYDYFEKLRTDLGAEAIAVAHHKDDIAETVLINLIRGTGIHGMTGIAAKRDNIVRPLLCVGRNDILEFLEKCGQKFVDDSSNFVDDVVRNKIRLNILPLMREINPSVTDAINATAHRLRLAANIFDNAMEQNVKKASVESSPEKSVYDIEMIRDEYILYSILKQYGFKSSAVENIYQAMSDPRNGACFCSNSHEMTFHRGKMIVMKSSKPFKKMTIPECGRYVIDEKGNTIVLRKVVIDGNFVLPKSMHTACFDAHRIVFPLTLRTLQNGDRFQPFGMRGTRLVSDLLTDMKINVLEKQRQLVLADADGNIVWVVGRRASNNYPIGKRTKEGIIVDISQ